MKEAFENTEAKPSEKIKATKADIVVKCGVKNPYYVVVFHEVGKKDDTEGFGSYNLKNVFLWREEAIEIVSEVEAEYENNVCEWFKYDYRTIAPRFHDAENPYWRIPENMDKLKFCPYCGKKIKVVD